MNKAYMTLPHGRPILMWFHTMPKPGTFVWQDQPRPIISLKFDVADNKYPEAAGQTYAYDFGTAIAGKDAKKPTKGYTFLCAIKGLTELPDFLNWTDATLWEKQDWELFWGYYPVVLSEATPSKSDPNKTYQRIVAVHNPEAIEFDVASRKTEIAHRAVNQVEPLGLPKTTQIPAKQAEPTPAPSFYPQFPPQEAAPAQQAPRSVTPIPVAEVMGHIKGYALQEINPNEYRRVINRFLRVKVGEGAKLDQLTKEEDLRHLYLLTQIQEAAYNGATGIIDGYLASHTKQLHELDAKEALFLLESANKAIDDDLPF